MDSKEANLEMSTAVEANKHRYPWNDHGTDNNTSEDDLENLWDCTLEGEGKGEEKADPDLENKDVPQ